MKLIIILMPFESFAPLSLSICIKDNRTGEVIEDEETQRFYLQLSLLKKLLNSLTNSEINFKFNYLIVTFQYPPYICYEEKAGRGSKNESYYKAKLVNIPNLYVEIKKLNESEVWKKLTKELEEEILKKGYDISFLYFALIRPSDYPYSPQR